MLTFETLTLIEEIIAFFDTEVCRTSINPSIVIGLGQLATLLENLDIHILSDQSIIIKVQPEVLFFIIYFCAGLNSNLTFL